MSSRLWVIALGLALLAAPAANAQYEDWPTELHDCFGDSVGICGDSVGTFLGESCGEAFYRYGGKIVWPLLRYVRPIVISVTAKWMDLRTVYPIFILVAPAVPPATDRCGPQWTGDLILQAQGARQCGGVTQSIGPLDLTAIFPQIQPGTPYSIQAVFFQTPEGRYSDGMSCIDVTTTTAISPLSWTRVKHIYR